jgi:peptide/nickel transport system substrate-binding protein
MGPLLRGAVAALAVALSPVLVHAAEVRIATRTDTDAIDPQYHVYAPNIGVARHIFDALVLKDGRSQLHPGLALSWTAVADDVWEFKLRPGVRFHDGGAFTAEDVAFSLERAPHVPNSPSSFGIYTKRIADVQVVDPLTVRIRTHGPAPTLPNDLSAIYIVSKHAAEGKTTADFNSGAATIGTGPYRFVEWIAADHLTLAKNPDYWGGAEPWDRAVLKPIGNDGARVAALLSGDVDMIEGVPGVDRARLAADPKLSVFECDSIRMIYIHLDSARDQSPGVLDRNGQKMDRNPLKDVRVRQAIDHAINRQALADRLLSGQAHPAGQLVPPGFFGASPNLPPPAYDPALSQKLLQEAGWGDGFSLVLAASNDRYPNDAQVAQAVAQMLTRVGIRTEVQTMPAAVLFSRGSKLDFSVFMAGWIADTGEASSALTALLASYDPKTGMGQSNRGRYSSQAFDATLAEALRTLDDGKRATLLGKASEIAMHDVGLVPVYFLVNTWATRKGLTYDARADELSLAMGLRPAK